jgi:hypothetical protein
MKLTVEVGINIGDRGTVSRHRDEVSVTIGDAAQMLADDPLGLVQVISRLAGG